MLFIRTEPITSPHEIAAQVLFQSTGLLHQVAPSIGARRLCFTTWLSQKHAPRLAGMLPFSLPPSHTQKVIKLL